MIAAGTTSPGRSPRLLLALRLERGLLWAGVLALAVAAAAVLASPSAFELPRLLEGEQLARFAAGVSVYALSHVLRFLRLALLAARPGVQMRRILQLQLLTAGLSVILPFKLSDLVRVRELGVVLGSFRTGLTIVWLERTLDAAVLLVLVVICATALPGSLEQLTPLLVVVCAFLAATLALLTIVPANLRLVMLHVVRRRGGERDVRALVALRAAVETVHPAPDLLRGRLATLLLFSAAIWIAEVGAVALAVPGIGAQVSELSAALLSVLSSVSSGLTPLAPGFGERLSESVDGFTLAADVSTYRAVLTLPALAAGTVAGAMYLIWRGREGVAAR